MIVRLLFINRNAVSLKDEALMASLAEPLAEFVIALAFPHWFADENLPFNTIREQGLQRIIHLGYCQYKAVMATRRARWATGRNSIPLQGILNAANSASRCDRGRSLIL